MASLALLCLAGLANAAVLPRQNMPANETSSNAFSLTNKQNADARASALSSIRDNFQYGPDVVSPGGAYFPKGSYADGMINFDKDLFFAEQLPWVQKCQADASAAAKSVAGSGGLKSLDDFKKFYPSFQTSVPGGPFPGMLENGTSDLLFSMERLSTAPLGLKRLHPNDQLAYKVEDAVAKNITGKTQSELLTTGALFYFDHRDQEKQNLTEGRYAGASDAFFFIHPKSGDFLPLAVRLNRGSKLVYTPADGPGDWLFAKMAFNMNNLWFEQWYHLQTTHYLADIVFMAAVRTLSVDHPVYGILDRLAYQTFAFRLSAILTLVNKGGPVDNLFFSPGSSAATYGDDLYFNGGAGDWLNSEFSTDLRNRGLLDCVWGPKLKHLPYHEDASVIDKAIKDFVTSYVSSYYNSDVDVANDSELAAFVKEATPAKIINFPHSVRTRADLIALIQHFAMTTGVVHSVTNGNDPVKSTASLPYHPMAFYKPLPTAKGLSESDIVTFMPNLTQSVGQITLLAAFNRPWISEGDSTGSNRTLANMFDLPSFLNRTNDATRKANENFKSTMGDFSKVVKGRGFDKDGLSQGMPFLWKVLDPLNTPFYLTV